MNKDFDSRVHELGWSVETAGPLNPRVRVERAGVHSPWFSGYENESVFAWISSAGTIKLANREEVR